MLHDLTSPLPHYLSEFSDSTSSLLLSPSISLPLSPVSPCQGLCTAHYPCLYSKSLVILSQPLLCLSMSSPLKLPSWNNPTFYLYLFIPFNPLECGPRRTGASCCTPSTSAVLAQSTCSMSIFVKWMGDASSVFTLTQRPQRTPTRPAHQLSAKPRGHMLLFKD